MSFSLRWFAIVGIALNYSCGFQVTTSGHLGNGSVSGIVRPLLGSIAHKGTPSLVPQAFAALCADPAFVRLYELKDDGTIDLTTPLMSQELKADARYTFDLSSFTSSLTVKHVVRVDGCNGEVFSRPITKFNDAQDIDAVTTTVSQVVNAESLINNKLNQIPKEKIEQLIHAISGSNTAQALNSLTNDAAPVNKFTEIFGVSPTVIMDARPDVAILTSTSQLSELVPFTFSSRTLHVDPSYAFAYRWKLNGVTVATSKNFTFTPHANQQGQHQLDYFVGKDDGAGNIDLTRPYFVRTFDVQVANTAPPVAPSIALNAATPSPRQVTNVDLDIVTGIAKSECTSFSSMAITDTAAQPGPMQFTFGCDDVVTQTESITFSSGDGSKTLYLWVRDESGMVSAPRSISFALDTTAPVVNLTAAAALSNDSTPSFSFTATDAHAVSFICRMSAGAWGACSSPYTSTALSDGSHSFEVKALDSAGNESVTSTTNFTVDATAPIALAFVRQTAAISNNTAVALTVTNCLDATQVFTTSTNSAPSIGDSGWQVCTTSAGGISATVSGDGVKSVYLWARDIAGNVSATANSVSMTLDTTAPVIVSGPTVTAMLAGNSTEPIDWTVTDLTGVTIDLAFYDGSSWSTITAGLANSGSYNWSVPALNINNARVRLTARDAAGNEEILESGNFIIDSSGPTITSFSVNNGDTQTPSNFVEISFTGQDSLSVIEKFCLKYNDPTNPSDTDECWKNLSAPPLSISPALLINVPLYSYMLGFGGGNYSIRLWLKDIHGHVSGSAHDEITFIPPDPPLIGSLAASSLDLPSNPATSSDLTVPLGSTVYVRWRATDNVALGANAISLQYKLSSSTTWQAIVGGQGLANSSNGPCTIDDPLTPIIETGCFVWNSSPSSGAFQVKLTVTGSTGINSSVTSVPLNGGNLALVAGNTDLGLGGSARSAIFLNDSQGESTRSGYLAVTPNGNIYFYDSRGIFRIKPSIGIMELLVPRTGVLNGLGGPVKSATLQLVRRLSVDHLGRVLVLEANGVLRFSSTEENPALERIVGGGLNNTTNVDALSFKMETSNDGSYTVYYLSALPNGDILFTSGDNLLRRFNSSQNKVHTISFTGQGIFGDSTALISNCPAFNFGLGYDSESNFDYILYSTWRGGSCSTSVGSPLIRINSSTMESMPSNYPTGHPGMSWTHMTVPHIGLNGEIYLITYQSGRILKLNKATNTFSNIIGNNIRGYCPDGTPALACSISPQDVFVDLNGKVYFLDGGRVRTILDSGNLLTIYGQWAADGDGSSATAARLDSIQNLSVTNDGKIQFMQNTQAVIREFEAGGNIIRLAGNGNNGSPTISQSALTQPLVGTMAWGLPNSFITDPASGEVYIGDSGRVLRLNRSSYMWEVAAGGGTTDYWSSPTINGYQARMGSARVLALLGGKILVNNFTHAGVSGDRIMSHWYDVADGGQTYFAGPDSVGSSGSCGGDALSTCRRNWSGRLSGGYLFDSVSDSFFTTNAYAPGSSNTIVRFSASGTGSYQQITLPRSITSMAYRRVDRSPDIDHEWLYYCSAGRLYKYNLTTSSETTLNWAVSDVSCSGATMRYDAPRDRLVFAIIQNNLWGIATYENP